MPDRWEIPDLLHERHMEELAALRREFPPLRSQEELNMLDKPAIPPLRSLYLCGDDTCGVRGRQPPDRNSDARQRNALTGAEAAGVLPNGPLGRKVPADSTRRSRRSTGLSAGQRKTMAAIKAENVTTNRRNWAPRYSWEEIHFEHSAARRW